MDFTRVIITLNNLNIKKALLAVFLLSITLSIPIIALLLKNESSIFTSASVSNDVSNEIDESKIPYPTSPPSIVHVTKFYGRPGDSILIYGQNFGEAQKESSIRLGSSIIPKSDVLYWSDTEIEFALPDNEGMQKLSVNVNGNETTWYGRVNVYTSLTPDVLFMDESENFIRVPNSNYDLRIYTISGEANVFGTEKVDIVKRQVPLDLADSNILYVELIKNGRMTNYKVEKP